jgi:hypothetical protein
MWFDVITVMDAYVTGNLVIYPGKNMQDGFLSANMLSKWKGEILLIISKLHMRYISARHPFVFSCLHLKLDTLFASPKRRVCHWYLLSISVIFNHIANHISGVIVRFLASSVIWRGLETRSCQAINLVLAASLLSTQHWVVRAKNGLVGIRIICRSGATCLLVDSVSHDSANKFQVIVLD